MATVIHGYEPTYNDPTEIFAYTSLQELATRVSHRNAGKITDDPAAFELMKNIAADENHHYIFYKGVMAAMLAENPSAVLSGIYRMLTKFEMPGVAVPGFMRRSINVAKAGVYNLRIHHDRVVTPLLRDWQIGNLAGLTNKASEFQDKIMAIPADIMEKAERFEKRVGLAPA